MEEAIARIINRKFTELAGRLHLPMLGRVVAVSDPLKRPELADDYRPRYAVDVQMLNERGQIEKDLPVYRSVPLPLPAAGIERGAFGFPETGTIVEVAFAYGLPDQPFIRTLLSRGQGIPALEPTELLWQQCECVQQQCDSGGNWIRETHGDIVENSLRRIIQAAKNLEEYGSEHKKISEHSTEEIAGVNIVEALGALRLLSGGTLNISALDNLNLTTASDINTNVGRDLKEWVGNIRDSLAKVKQLLKVESGGTVWIGTESLNVLKILSSLIQMVSDIADNVGTHTHPDVGECNQKPVFNQHKVSADGLKTQLDPIVE